MYRLGIDLGGTSAKIAVVDKNKKLVREGSVPTAGFPNAAALAKEIGNACKKMLGKMKISRAGVGVAGDIDFEKGVVRLSPNLGWKNVPLRALIQKEARVPVLVDNDANAAAWGLYHTQIPKSVKHLIVATLGTGVGGGIIIDGKMHRGATNTAGEIGHMRIEEDGPLCNCGNRGCLETYVGGPHLVKKVRAALENGQKSRLQDIFQRDPDQITPLVISQAAHDGDAYALSVWNDVGYALGRAFGDLIYILNPQMVVFTGGVAQAKNLILKPFWETLRQRAFKGPVAAVKVKVAEKASHIGVIGASLLE